MRWSRRDENDTTLGELMDDDTTEHPRVVVTAPEDPARPAPATRGFRSETGVEDETVPAAPADQDSFLDDEDYLPQERTGPGRLTVALVAALVLAVGVLGGIWVQKQFGAGTATSAAGTRTGTGTGNFPGGGTRNFPGGGASGMPGGGASGMPGGGMPGGDASGGTGGGSGGGATTQTQATPVVVGTVTTKKGDSLVVTDLGGTKHTVKVGDSTTVTLPYDHSSLKAGDTVAVVGAKADDGTVTATGLTVT